MKRLLSGGLVLTETGIKHMDIAIHEGKVFSLKENIDNNSGYKVIPCDNFFIIPGFIDVHVHFREPGFTYKETIKTGAASAYAAGYQTVCTMPNLNPAPYNLENLKVQLDAIKKDSKVEIIPYGRITAKGSKIADMEDMAPYVVGYSDDGKGVQEDAVMKDAMQIAKALGKPIVAHCEDEKYDTYDPRSEYLQVERDIKLVQETGCKYHICHVSTKESVELVRQAKKARIDVTCETAPHYLIFENSNLPDNGRFKMNPPIRTAADRNALLEGFADGTVDVIATDHAPHSIEEKSRGFKDSLFGIVGLESAFPALYTNLVLRHAAQGEQILNRLIDAMIVRPSCRFNIGRKSISEGDAANMVIIDITGEYVIDPSKFKTKGRSCPFEGMKVTGKPISRIIGEEIIPL